MLSGPKPTIRRARALRKSMSLPEVLLWRELRKRPGGFKFRRQHPAGSYVLDFYCAEAKLAIEVDGMVHDRGDRPRLDAIRDAWLMAQGVLTLRLAASEVLHDPAATIAGIMTQALARSPLHRPTDGPPPRFGED